MKKSRSTTKRSIVWLLLPPVLWLLFAYIGKDIWLPAAKTLWNSLAESFMRASGRWFATWEGKASAASLVYLVLLLSSATLWLTVCILRFRNRVLATVFLGIGAVLQCLCGNRISAVFLILWVCVTLWIFGKSRKEYPVMFFRILPLVLAGCLLSVVLPDSLGGEAWSAGQHKLICAIQKLQYGGNEDPLPSGDFTQISDRKDSDAVALEVTMEHPASIYLKGFVGSEFSDNRWTMTDAKTRAKSADLFYWLHRDGFSGNGQLASGFQALHLPVVTSQVQVKNVGASRAYQYLPYEYSEGQRTLKNGEILGEEGIKSSELRGSRSYTFSMAEQCRVDYQKILQSLTQENLSAQAQQYRRSEQFYNAYVYDVYTRLSEEQRQIIAGVLEGTGAAGTDKKQNSTTDITAIKETILNTLAEQMSYTDEITEAADGKKTEKLSDRKDLLKSFLEITHRGYDVHYATAAALMFRYYHIPARYVEGYLITPSDVRGKKDGTTLKISQSNAHAWVEYYQDGAGWIPFEVSPPYIGMMQEAKLTTAVKQHSVKKQEEQKKKITADNYEKTSENGKVRLPVKKIRLVLQILLVVILALLIGWYLQRRKKTVQERKRRLHAPDRNQRIIAQFEQMLEVWFTYLCAYENRPLDAYCEQMHAYESENGIQYPQMLALYRRARFDNHTCTQKEEDTMEQYTTEVLQRMYQACSFWQKQNWKWWKGVRTK